MTFGNGDTGLGDVMGHVYGAPCGFAGFIGRNQVFQARDYGAGGRNRIEGMFFPEITASLLVAMWRA